MKVGIDSVIIKRFQKMKKLTIFLEKNFTKYEKTYIESKNKHKYETLAGLFCLKEAFLKALGVGIYSSISLIDIEINHKEQGTPYIVINEKIKNILEKENLKTISASITHTKKTAIAICIIE